MTNIVDLNANKPPVVYVVRVAQHWDGHLEYFLEDVKPDDRSILSVAWALRQMSDALYAEHGAPPADISARLRENADIDEAEGCTASVVALEREAAAEIDRLIGLLADINFWVGANPEARFSPTLAARIDAAMISAGQVKEPTT